MSTIKKWEKKTPDRIPERVESVPERMAVLYEALQGLKVMDPKDKKGGKTITVQKEPVSRKVRRALLRLKLATKGRKVARRVAAAQKRGRTHGYKSAPEPLKTIPARTNESLALPRWAVCAY